jgi:hypothetical protein
MISLRISVMKFYQMASVLKHVKWRKNNGYKAAITSSFHAPLLTLQLTFGMLNKQLNKYKITVPNWE